jgi:hypothetical protein
MQNRDEAVPLSHATYNTNLIIDVQLDHTPVDRSSIVPHYLYYNHPGIVVLSSRCSHHHLQ